jgi:hypothetical protein
MCNDKYLKIYLQDLWRCSFLKINLNRITINIIVDGIMYPLSYVYGQTNKKTPAKVLINSKATGYPVLFAISVCDNLSCLKVIISLAESSDPFL